jgi:hypothetical protein
MSIVVYRPPCVEAVEMKTPAQNPEGGRTNLWREAPHEFAIRGPHNQRTAGHEWRIVARTECSVVIVHAT